MIVSHEWLKQFVPHSLTAQEAGELLSRHCVTLDNIEEVGAELAHFVIARVVKAGPHPNSDHLWVTKVDDGSGELLDVVCGAPVVKEGSIYPFARTGTQMPNGIVIEKRKIRGEVSNGMLCSARELGLGDDHAGIMELETSEQPGTPLLNVLALSDSRIDLDVLPNRPDLLSHLGVAREIAALTGAPLNSHPVSDFPNTQSTFAELSDASSVQGKKASVHVKDLVNCPQYIGVVIEGVSVADSPDWLKRRLASVGIRSISNVVDATNYVLHAYGQPVHAFDLDRLNKQSIVVRPTIAGESITTLDGATHKLAEGTTVICDGDAPVALAGVMGGLNSEVTASTSRILLEVASFNARFVRTVRKAVGISTDASYRFERGTDIHALHAVAKMTAQLIAYVAGGEVVELLSVGRSAEQHKAVTLRSSRVSTLLGIDVSDSEIARRLELLGCSVAATGNGVFAVTPPSWRHDLLIEVDLIEEIARLAGYDTLPNELRPFRPGNAPDDALHVRSEAVRDVLVASGFLEARPMPFTSVGDESTPRVLNPLAEDEPYLRSSLLDTLRTRVEYNFARMQRNIRLFEVGHAFVASGARLPREEMRVAVVLTGDRRPIHFTEPKPPAFDQWDAKTIAERVARVAYPGERVAVVSGASGDSDVAGLLWQIVVGENRCGSVVRLSTDAPEWAATVYAIEILLGVVSSADVAAPASHLRSNTEDVVSPSRTFTRYKALPSMPAAEFDLALLVTDNVAAIEVDECIRRSAGELLESLLLFDEYRGSNLEAGTRSLAWRLTLRHPERTLKEKEIEGRRAKILSQLSKELGVRPRAT